MKKKRRQRTTQRAKSRGKGSARRARERVGGIRISGANAVYWFKDLLDESGRLDIGRTNQRAIRIRDMTVSRRHCEIERTAPGKYILRDLDSYNGIKVRIRGHYGKWVKQKRDGEVQLLPGIHIKLGNAIIVPVDAKGMFPINARDYEELACLAAETYGSATKAGKLVGRSRHWVAGKVKAMLKRLS